MTDKPIYEILAEMGRAAMPDDLPEPYYPQWSHSNEFNAYTADQMCAYAAAAVAKERDLRMAVCAQAYQVVGSLLSDLVQFDSEHATKILDNLSAGAVVHDVLPWPSFAQSNKDGPPSNEFYRIALNNISIRKTSNEQS